MAILLVLKGLINKTKNSRKTSRCFQLKSSWKTFGIQIYTQQWHNIQIGQKHWKKLGHRFLRVEVGFNFVRCRESWDYLQKTTNYFSEKQHLKRPLRFYFLLKVTEKQENCFERGKWEIGRVGGSERVQIGEFPSRFFFFLVPINFHLKKKSNLWKFFSRKKENENNLIIRKTRSDLPKISNNSDEGRKNRNAPVQVKTFSIRVEIWKTFYGAKILMMVVLFWLEPVSWICPERLIYKRFVRFLFSAPTQRCRYPASDHRF